jgi:transcription elongation factor Elf1
MSDTPDTIEPPLPTFHKARLKPLDWQVDCPCCGTVILVDACENDDASWHADGTDQFPECDECGALIEVLSVQIVEISA